MKKCLLDQQLCASKFPDNFRLFEELLSTKTIGGGLLQTIQGDYEHSAMHTLNRGMNFSCSTKDACIPPLKELVLNPIEVTNLQAFYRFLYPNENVIFLNNFVLQSTQASFRSNSYGSRGCQNERSSVFVAYWPSNVDVEFTSETVTLPLSVGEIQFFISHRVKFSSRSDVNHVFAYVHCFCKHTFYNWFGSSAIVCTHTCEKHRLW